MKINQIKLEMLFTECQVKFRVYSIYGGHRNSWYFYRLTLKDKNILMDVSMSADFTAQRVSTFAKYNYRCEDPNLHAIVSKEIRSVAELKRAIEIGNNLQSQFVG